MGLWRRHFAFAPAGENNHGGRKVLRVGPHRVLLYREATVETAIGFGRVFLTFWIHFLDVL